MKRVYFSVFQIFHALFVQHNLLVTNYISGRVWPWNESVLPDFHSWHDSLLGRWAEPRDRRDDRRIPSLSSSAFVLQLMKDRNAMGIRSLHFL